MEKDDELKGNGNSYDFGARIYDPRLGRYLSIDPDFFKYPWNSPYDHAINSPIRLIDKNGEGPDFVRNNTTSVIVLTGEGTITTNGIDVVKRGKIILRPGDVYEELGKTTKGGVTQTNGRIIRANGIIVATIIDDIDFIDIQANQTFEVDGKKITDTSGEFNDTEFVKESETVGGDETKNTDKDFIPTPNKGEIKLSDPIGSVILTDMVDTEPDKNKAQTKKEKTIKVELKGLFGSAETKK
jgi:RHS repeat-associated protein